MKATPTLATLTPMSALNLTLILGKFPWEVDETGFPTGCTHSNLQGRDFQPLKKGDPMLRHPDGSVTSYDGDEGLCPVFVNEGAYYSAASGLGIGLARAVTIDTETMATKPLKLPAKL